MKILPFIVTLLIFLGSISFSQTADSISSRKNKTDEQRTFKDQDGDGISDASKGKKMKKRDTFIDTNGDGICDSREHGLGFKRMNKQNGNQPGKSSKQNRGEKK